MKKNVLIMLCLLVIAVFIVGCGTEIADEDVPEGMTKEEYAQATGQEVSEESAIAGQGYSAPRGVTKTGSTCIGGGPVDTITVITSYSDGYEDVVTSFVKACSSKTDRYGKVFTYALTHDCDAEGIEMIQVEKEECEAGCNNGVCSHPGAGSSSGAASGGAGGGAESIGPEGKATMSCVETSTGVLLTSTYRNGYKKETPMDNYCEGNKAFSLQCKSETLLQFPPLEETCEAGCENGVCVCEEGAETGKIRCDSLYIYGSNYFYAAKEVYKSDCSTNFAKSPPLNVSCGFWEGSCIEDVGCCNNNEWVSATCDGNTLMNVSLNSCTGDPVTKEIVCSSNKVCNAEKGGCPPAS